MASSWPEYISSHPNFEVGHVTCFDKWHGGRSDRAPVQSQALKSLAHFLLSSCSSAIARRMATSFSLGQSSPNLPTHQQWGTKLPQPLWLKAKPSNQAELCLEQQKSSPNPPLSSPKEPWSGRVVDTVWPRCDLGKPFNFSALTVKWGGLD